MAYNSEKNNRQNNLAFGIKLPPVRRVPEGQSGLFFKMLHFSEQGAGDAFIPLSKRKAVVDSELLKAQQSTPDALAVAINGHRTSTDKGERGTLESISVVISNHPAVKKLAALTNKSREREDLLEEIDRLEDALDPMKAKI